MPLGKKKKKKKKEWSSHDEFVLKRGSKYCNLMGCSFSLHAREIYEVNIPWAPVNWTQKFQHMEIDSDSKCKNPILIRLLTSQQSPSGCGNYAFKWDGACLLTFKQAQPDPASPTTNEAQDEHPWTIMTTRGDISGLGFFAVG